MDLVDQIAACSSVPDLRAQRRARGFDRMLRAFPGQPRESFSRVVIVMADCGTRVQSFVDPRDRNGCTR
jgi:hypothetical protein